MPDLLSGLNPQQVKAVTASPGPTLILAGPGSGKTRVLTNRIAYLIQQGTPPFRIMAVTFTNKAAREMRERVEKLLGGALGGLTIGTFHSICARFLRREAGAQQHPERSGAQSKDAVAPLHFTRDFVIFDDADQLAVVKQAMEKFKLDDKQYRPQGLLAAISKAKNELIPPEEFRAETYFAEIAGRVYAEYQKLLRLNNALDFDDLLTETAYLFRHNPEVLARYQQFYDHVLVDEFQDTNTAQYTLLRQLTATKHNLYVVGDPDQCFPTGSLIQTPDGPKPIETIRVGSQVVAASGRGSSMPADVAHIESRSYQGELVKVTTRQGYSFRTTPNHIVFTRLGVSADVHYVYLMYRDGLGYRVGITIGARSDGESPELQIGLKVRGNGEEADRIWILRVCSSREEAYYWESFYAFQYGIPTTVFHVQGRRMRMSQDAINRLYKGIDTHERAECLLADLKMDMRFPHYIPKAKLLRHVVNLRYFGDQRRSLKTPWNAHRISICSSDAELRRKLEACGYHVRKGRRNTWRTELSRLQYDDAQAIAKELSKAGDGMEIVTGAFLLEADNNSLPARRFSLMPASHLHPSMLVAIECEGQVIQDEIAEVEWETYNGKVYDLEVAELHNYVAGGVVVHNSVYRWRGADYRNVRRFQDDHPDAITILLEQNYRSTQLILDAAMAVIDKNVGRTRKELFTERDGGRKIEVYEAYNEDEEGRYIVEMISTLALREKLNPGDAAVMYRTNAQSRAIENAFIQAGLPYRLVGGTRFYSRREVKDALAFLRLVHNPADSVSLMRVINIPPRGLGAKTLEGLQRSADSAGIPSSVILRDLGEKRSKSEYATLFTGKAGGALGDFGEMLNTWVAAKDSISVVKLIDMILRDTEYQRFINDGSEEGEERWENVMELRGVAAENPELTLGALLEEVALVADVDSLDENNSAGPTLLTLHSAKGLEFPVVFIAGLDEDIFPHKRSMDDAEEMAEERRLMYVGLTRAKDRIFLTRAFRRAMFGDFSQTNPSRFLADIPTSLLKGHVSKSNVAAYKQATTWDSPLDRPGRGGSVARPAKRETVVETGARYRTGQRVKHSLFGEGMIIESKGSGDDEIIVVAFEGAGVKRLAASMVELKVLKG